MTSVSAGSALSAASCTSWDGAYNSIDFSPNTATGASNLCVDTEPIWIYQIDQAGLAGDENALKVSVDSANSKIWIKAMTGETKEQTYTIDVIGHLPGTSFTDSFPITIVVSCCS